LIRNACCNTLEQTNILSVSYDLGDLMQDAVNMLLLNVPNLTQVGDTDGIRLEHILEAEKFGLTSSKLDMTHSIDLTTEKVEKMRKVCPVLKKLYTFLHHNVDALQELHTCESITDFHLRAVDNIGIYEGILATEWRTLKKLYINRFQGINVGLNLTAFAKALVNLEQLLINFCTADATWDGKTMFQSLKHFNVIFMFPDVEDVGNLSWMRSFSKTIVSVNFQYNKKNIPINSVSTLLRDSYPKLEAFEISSLKFDTETVKAVVDNCPMLQVIGRFRTEDFGKIKECKKLLVKQNIDCSLCVVLH